MAARGGALKGWYHNGVCLASPWPYAAVAAQLALPVDDLVGC